MDRKTHSFPSQKVPGYRWVWGIIVGLITMSYYPLPGIILFLVGLLMSMKILNSSVNKGARIYNKGLRIYQKGFIDMAIQLWEEALRKDPDNVFAHRALCMLCHEHAKNPTVALEHGKRVLALDAANTPVVYKMGEILFDMEKFDQAAAILQTIDPQGDLAEERGKLLKRCLARKKG